MNESESLSNENPDAEAAALPLAYRKGSSTEGILPIAGFVIGDQVGTRLFGDVAGDRLAIILMTLAASWAVLQRHQIGRASCRERV